eukprot:ANDGO_07210.mRNA.1 hypothetical protein SPRG_14249
MKYVWTIALLAFAGFAASAAQSAVIIVFPAMTADASLGFDKRAASIVNASGNAGNIFGSLIALSIGDRVGGRILVCVATGGSAIAVMIFSLSRTLPLFATMYALHCVAASLAFPGAIIVARKWALSKSEGKAVGTISASVRLGGVAGSLVSGGLLSSLSWSEVLLIGMAVVGFGFLLVIALLREQPPPSGHADRSEPVGQFQRKSMIHSILIPLFVMPSFWLLVVASVSFSLILEFQYFFPLYLMDNFGSSSSAAGLWSSVFPGGMVIAALLGGLVQDRVSNRRLSAVMFLTTSCFSVLWTLLLWLASEDQLQFDFYLQLILFGLTGASSVIVPSLIVPWFAMHLGGRDGCSTIVGAISIFNFGGALLFDTAVRDIVQSGSWNQIAVMLFSFSIIGTFSSCANFAVQQNVRPAA